MTDPDFADATYIEPITPQVIEEIIKKEKPDAILPTMGGQTALNCALDLHRHGVLERHGVELIGAAMLLIEIGTDMDAFGSPDRLASWVGVCPGNNESAGKRKSGRVRKGNLYVRRLLCEFAHAASRTTSVFKSKFQSLVLRRGYKRAIIAIGHKILRTIFFMLKRREHYRGSATDYEALCVQRNAPRWIKALTKFGFITQANA